MSTTHQLGEDQFKAMLPEEIVWRPFPAFPPTVRLAVLVGDPTKPGPYATRVKAAKDARTMPHRHTEDRVYTVISGIFYVGFGTQFDGDALTAYPPGTTLILPSGTWHYHWAKSSEYIVQVNAIGPLGMEYANPADDPRLT
jgi:quercetin dioxygenase-like cupin family protein